MTNCLSPLNEEVAYTNTDPVAQENRASFSARLMAIIIDGVLLSIVYGIGILLGGYRVAQVVAVDFQLIYEITATVPLLLLLGPIFLSMTYFTILHGWSGRTIGKAIMGLSVVTASGRPMGMSRSFLRWAGYQISALPLLAGFLWAVLDIRQRAWHDIIADSKVVIDKTS
jgi:uncharacterized RDD family membrane protein YckC